jgi:hypothetical protein
MAFNGNQSLGLNLRCALLNLTILHLAEFFAKRFTIDSQVFGSLGFVATELCERFEDLAGFLACELSLLDRAAGQQTLALRMVCTIGRVDTDDGAYLAFVYDGKKMRSSRPDWEIQFCEFLRLFANDERPTTNNQH